MTPDQGFADLPNRVSVMNHERILLRNVGSVMFHGSSVVNNGSSVVHHGSSVPYNGGFWGVNPPA